jgi:hypothetical protein
LVSPARSRSIITTRLRKIRGWTPDPMEARNTGNSRDRITGQITGQISRPTLAAGLVSKDAVRRE